jgi:hypothetical protein
MVGELQRKTAPSSPRSWSGAIVESHRRRVDQDPRSSGDPGCRAEVVALKGRGFKSPRSPLGQRRPVVLVGDWTSRHIDAHLSILARAVRALAVVVAGRSVDREGVCPTPVARRERDASADAVTYRHMRDAPPLPPTGVVWRVFWADTSVAGRGRPLCVDRGGGLLADHGDAQPLLGADEVVVVVLAGVELHPAHAPVEAAFGGRVVVAH